MNVRYVYGDDSGAIITRNARATIKLDFFITNDSSGSRRPTLKTIIPRP